MNELDLSPTWAAAVEFYIEVIQNPRATAGAIIGAKEDLRRLARIVDRLQAEQEAEA